MPQGKGYNFTALEEKEPEFAMPRKTGKKEKYFPTAHIDKSIPGLPDVGKETEVVMRVRVKGISKSANGRNSTTLELLSIGTGKKRRKNAK